MNKVKEMRESNNKLDDKLTKENNSIMTDIVCYLRSSDIYDEQIEEIRQDLLYMFLDAQNQNCDIHERIGHQIKAFCDEIIANTPKKTMLEKIMEFLEIVSMEFLVLSILLILINTNYKTLFQKGIFQTHIQIPISTLIMYTALLILPIWIVRYVTKTALNEEKAQHRNTKFKISILSSCICGISVLILILLLRDTDTLSVSYIIVVCISFCSALCYGILAKIVKSLHKKHIKMTKTLS